MKITGQKWHLKGFDLQAEEFFLKAAEEIERISHGTLGGHSGSDKGRRDGTKRRHKSRRWPVVASRMKRNSRDSSPRLCCCEGQSHMQERYQEVGHIMLAQGTARPRGIGSLGASGT